MSMEENDLDFHYGRMPVMKASMDIPYGLLNNNLKFVDKRLKDFSSEQTDGKLIISAEVEDGEQLCFNAAKIVDDKDEPILYDLEVSKTETSIKIMIFKFKDALIMTRKEDGIDYFVNMSE